MLRTMIWVLLVVIAEVALFFLLLFSDWIKQELVLAIPIVVCAHLIFLAPKLWQQWVTFSLHRAARKELTERSNTFVAQIVCQIPGIPESIPRREADLLAQRLRFGQRVLLLGEPGTGKTGILRQVWEKLRDQPLILLDAREFADCDSIEDIGRSLCVTQIDIIDCIRAWGKRRKAVLILDQFDSIMHTPSRTLLLDFVTNCATEQKLGIVLVVRPHEAHGMLELLRTRPNVVAYKIDSLPLEQETAREMLTKIGIPSPSEELIELARNLLELSLIADVVRSEGPDSIAGVGGEIGLWEKYRSSLAVRESANGLPDARIVASAVELATLCLRHARGSCQLSNPRTREQERLISCLVLRPDLGERYRFRHERLRDYLFAWHATHNEQWSWTEIKMKIGAVQAGVLVELVSRLYHDLDPELHNTFVAEVLND